MPTFSIPHFHLWESEVRHNSLWNRGVRNSCTAVVTRLFWSLPQTCQLASLWNQPWVSSCDSKYSRLAVNLVSFFGLEKQSTIPILFKWLIIYKLGRRNLLSVFTTFGRNRNLWLRNEKKTDKFSCLKLVCWCRFPALGESIVWEKNGSTRTHSFHFHLPHVKFSLLSFQSITL